LDQSEARDSTEEERSKGATNLTGKHVEQAVDYLVSAFKPTKYLLHFTDPFDENHKHNLTLQLKNCESGRNFSNILCVR